MSYKSNTDFSKCQLIDNRQQHLKDVEIVNQLKTERREAEKGIKYLLKR